MGTGSPTATVVNYGSINAGGLAALVAPGVRNSGSIVANVAILGAGEGFALDYYGDGLVNFAITNPVTELPRAADGTPVEALVVNDGRILSDGGQVILTADAAADVIDTVINLDGVEFGDGIENRGGQVVILGGDEGTVQVAGSIDVSGEGPGDQGGTVHVLGERLVLDLGAEIDASGPAGGGTVLIGGAERGGPLAAGGHIAYAEPDPDEGGGTQIQIDTTTPFETESYIPTADITYFDEGATVDAGAPAAEEGDGTEPSGEGGTVVVWGTEEVYFHGTINTMGGSRNGFVEVSTLGTGVIDGIATTGEFLLDPQDVCVRSATRTCNGGLVTPAFVFASTIKGVLDLGGTFTINTSGTDVDGDGNPDGGTLGGTGRVLFVNTTITVNNNGPTQGTFRIEAAGSIDLGETLFGSDGSTGTNYQFIAGTSAGGTPNNDADIDTGGQTLNSGGGDVLLNAADDVFINDPLITNGGNVTVFANGFSGTSTVSFGEDDGRIQTTDGNGGAGEVLIEADNIVFNTAAEPVINANGTGGIVTFRPNSAGRGINLGTSTVAALSLTDAELDRIAASVLRFGSLAGSIITISAPISPAQVTTLSLITGLNIVDANASGTDITVNGLALQTGTGTFGLTTNVSNLAFSNNVGGVAITNSSAVTIASLDGVTSSSSNSGVFIAAPEVRTDVDVTVFGSLTFDAPAVTLNGDLSANLIIGNATTVDVVGSDGGAEIQDAIELAVDGAVVFVGAGTFDPFVVDKDITIIGDGFTNTTAIDVDAGEAGATITSSGATVSAMLFQGVNLGTAGDRVGVLVDGVATPGITEVTIADNGFADLTDGVRSRGDIGTGAGVTDVSIIGTVGAPSLFEDMADAAIDVGDTDGSNAVYLVQDVTVRDGDGDGLSTGEDPTEDGDGFRFGAVGIVTVRRVDITDTDRDGIGFGALDAASISISESSIAAGRHGILFGGSITGSATLIDIFNNTLIQGANQGIVFTLGTVTDATVRIRGNGTDASNGIRAPNDDAIAINNEADVTLVNATFIIGGDDPADGNFIVGGSQAIDVDAISGGRFVVANNDLIQGGPAIEFERAITNNAEIVIANNGDIAGGRGVQFEGNIDSANVTISGNTFTNTNNDAIRFFDPSGGTPTITDATVTIGSATNVTLNQTTVTVGGNTMDGSGNGSGIDVEVAVQGDTDFIINGNAIGSAGSRVGEDGIAFRAGILDTATVTIGTNQVFATEQAIQIDDLQSPSTLSITGGTYNGTGGALLVDNTGVAGTDGLLNVGAAAYVGGGGSTVFEVLTDTGNAGVDIDFNGAATFDGGATGIRLSGPGIDILNDTLGTIAFTNQTTNYIELANGAEFQPGAPTVIDATNVTFGGLLGSAMTPAQLIATENMIVHFPDDNTLGLIDIATLFVVQGESIQTAVNAAGLLAAPQTVVVGAGTFGGSVEVWVDDLTLQGQGATTVIDTDDVDPFANNGDVDNGFHVAAFSATSGVADPSGVTIDGFAFDTVTTSGANIGVELGEAGVSEAVDATVQNSSFDDLNNGIVAREISGTTTISNVTMTDIASRGILFRPILQNDDVIVIEDSNIASTGDAVRFASGLENIDITITGSALTSTDEDGIHFASLLNNVRLLVGGASAAEGNAIQGGNDGVDFTNTITGSDLVFANNSLIQGIARDALHFDTLVSADTRVSVVGNTLIRGGFHALLFGERFLNSTLSVAGNTDILGNVDEAIQFVDEMDQSDVTIGTATVAVNGVDTAFGGNGSIVGATDGISAEEIDRTTFLVTDNALVRGAGVDGNGILVSSIILRSSEISIVGNTTIQGTVSGINLRGPANNSALTIADNTTIRGERLDGITIRSASNGSTIVIAQNEQILGDGFGGIFVVDDLTDTEVIIGEATVAVDGTPTAFGGNGDIVGVVSGVTFDGINGGSVTVANNDLIRGDFAFGIFAGDITADALFAVVGNTAIRGGDGAGVIDFDNGISIASADMSTIAIAGNDDIIGNGNVGILVDGNLTDTDFTIGTASVLIDGVLTQFGGNGNIVGSAVGVAVQDITGGSFTVDNNTLIRGDTVTGILADEITANAEFAVVGNTEIRGGDGGGVNGIDGIAIGSADTSRIVIAGNSAILGEGFDAIFIDDGVTDSDVTIGTASVLIDGVLTPFGGNAAIIGAEDGINIGAISGGTVTVSNNAAIRGTTGTGIEFDDTVSNTATVAVVGNNSVQGGEEGVEFDGTVDDSAVTIAGNTAITGDTTDGILFSEALTNATVVIGPATVSIDGTPTDFGGNTDIAGGVNGILFNNAIGGTSTVAIDLNGTAELDGVDYDGTEEVVLADFVIDGRIRGTTGSGIAFADILDDAAVTVSRNMIDGSGNGISFNGGIASTGTTAVHNNFLLENGGNGIVFAGDIASRTEVFQNFIANNGGNGILVDQGAALSPDSLFVQINFLPGTGFGDGNGGFGYNQLGVGTPDLQANWWGSPNGTGFPVNFAQSINGVAAGDLPTLVVLTTGDDDANTSPPFGNTAFEFFAFQPETIGPPIEPPFEFDPFPTDTESLLDEIRNAESQTDRPGGAAFFTNELAEPFQTSVFTDTFAIGQLQPAAGGNQQGPVNLGDLEPAAGPGSQQAQADDTCVATYFGDFWNTEAACQ